MKQVVYFLLFAILKVTVFSQSGQKWPYPIPCRIHDGKNEDLMVMTLGNVETPLADGVFDPSNDEVRLKGGTVIKNYFRDSLGIRFYAPIDKLNFPLPPSGWCSWYYYYQEIDENEVKRNAEWITNNLKDYGARYIQIDDGWQGTGHGLGENRDWTTVDKRFSSGMDKLAEYIRDLGLQSGIWLAPHGQSSKGVVKSHPNTFLQKPDGSSASDTWEGKFLIDPSTTEGQEYLKNLFSTLSRWGYDYFKIDGQPIVMDEYQKKRSLMRDTSGESNELYRKTLTTIRKSIGPNRYLLGCWGRPVEGIGIMNGSRTGGDIVLGWDGFETALAATMSSYFLHNIVWYCDPDVMLLRYPLSLDQARAWATLQGLTGQAVMASDRMMDLSNERVEIVKKVFPAVDVRPLDLFPSRRNKRVWDLKVSHLGQIYDVVGVFNFDNEKKNIIYLSWKDLGLPEHTPIHVFDFWNSEYLGSWEKGISVEVSPTSCRVLSLLPGTDHVQLMSTNRHITQGWVDLFDIRYDAKRNAFTGKSRIVKNDPYAIHFVFPRGKNFRIRTVKAGDLPVKVSNHQGWATMEIVSPTTVETSWEVAFEPTIFYKYPVQKPSNVSVEPLGLDGVTLRWEPQYNLNLGYQVHLNGELLGHTPTNAFAIRDLDPDREYSVSVRTVWEDGNESEDQTGKFVLKAMVPPEVSLAELEPVRATIGWGSVKPNRAVSGGALSIGGKKFAKGIGTHANSDIEFKLYGLYETFSTVVGIDDGNQSEEGSVEFFVLGDGKELWKSGILKKRSGANPVCLNIAGIHTLVLRVNDGGDGINYDHADWAEALVARSR